MTKGKISSAKMKQIVDSMKKCHHDSCFYQRDSDSNDFTISRVPPDMFHSKKRYFEPSVICIGPYHHGKDKYQPMEYYKCRQFQDILKRISQTNLETLVENLCSSEQRARSCYFEPIKMSSDDFIRMLLLDGCFILGLFLPADQRNIKKALMNNKDSVMIDQIYNDLFLLENQLPFFILQTLFNCLNLQQLVDRKSLDAIITGNRRFPRGEACASVHDKIEINHLLHLVHLLRIPQKLEQAHPNCAHQQLELPSTDDRSTHGETRITVQNEEYKKMEKPNGITDDKNSLRKIISAKRLQEAGITFKKKTSAQRLIDNIDFEKGVLEIPHISVDDSKARLLMNLVAFEQSILPLEKRLLSCYMGFMDKLVDTAEDAEILEQNGILQIYLNSYSETASFFNHIVDHAVVGYEDDFVNSVVDKVNKYTETTWPRWRAKFIRDYIFSPWAVFSLVAALLLLSLAFIQTICTVYPCNKR